MRCFPERERLLRVAVLLGVLAITAGCGSSQKLASARVEVDRLRKLNDTYVAALVDSKQATQRLRQESSLAREKQKIAAADAESFGVRFAALQEEARTLTAERDDANARLAASVNVREKLGRTLKAVQNQAAQNVEELADLRQSVVEYDARVQGLRATTASLRKEFSRVNHELDRVRSDLVTKESVIRSMSTGGRTVVVLSKKLAAMEDQKRELVAKCTALTRRLESRQVTGGVEVAKADPGTDAKVVAVAVPSSESRAAAPGGAADFPSLVRARAGSILAGDAAWDGVDVTLTVASIGVLFFVLWLVTLPSRLRKKRYLNEEIDVLHQKLHGFVNADRDGEEQRSSVARQGRKPLAGGSFIRRPGQFSPIISNQHRDELPVAEGHDRGAEIESNLQIFDEVTEEVEELTVNLGRMDSAMSQPPGATTENQTQMRSVSPEASWDDDEDSGDDELARTQIISHLDDLGGEDMDQATPRGRASKPDAAAKSRKDDREFTAELKDMIGQKVDEIIH